MVTINLILSLAVGAPSIPSTIFCTLKRRERVHIWWFGCLESVGGGGGDVAVNYVTIFYYFVMVTFSFYSNELIKSNESTKLTESYYIY